MPKREATARFRKRHTFMSDEFGFRSVLAEVMQIIHDHCRV
jgi:hypothetical protein